MFAICLCFLCAAVLKQMDFRSNQISVVAEVLISALKRYRKRFISSIMIRLPMKINLDLRDTQSLDFCLDYRCRGQLFVRNLQALTLFLTTFPLTTSDA